MTTTHASELAAGERFAFGANWASFLKRLDDARIAEAERSLVQMLGDVDLRGRTVLDIGSGSGLFSLAARRLGATVTSFDYDPQSVACTAELKRRYFPDDATWTVLQGSVLDVSWLAGLGRFDLVYSWGVLHHTGALWQALDNAIARVAPGGRLFIALYNDQGRMSKVWWRIKRAYCACPRLLRWTILLPCFVRLWGPSMVRDLLILRPFRTWRTYAARRGMSPWHDVIDWVGGFPFEVSRPEEILDWGRRHGFVLDRMTTAGGALGCNQFVLGDRRPPAPGIG